MQTPHYENTDFALYHGDCLKVLSEFPENSIDLIFADPPYLLSNDGFTVQSGKKTSVNKGDWDKSQGLKQDFNFHYSWIQACRRILKPNGTIWISGTYHSIYQCGFALQITKFHILNDVSWYKPNHQPNFSRRTLTASHETLIWAKKDKHSKHTFNYEYLKETEFPKDSLKKLNNQMHTVWVIDTPNSQETIPSRHPTQKPLALLERIILGSSNPGDTVLDPFTGSSTTGIAATKHDRKFIGIDIDKQYLELSKERYLKQHS